jgi:hypothetical protein
LESRVRLRLQARREGDRLLRAAIAFDGVTHNGGLGHSLEVLGSDEAREAAAAFRQFGLTDAARVVEDALALGDEGAQEKRSQQYYEAAALLDTAFARYYADHPDEFDPPQ